MRYCGSPEDPKAFAEALISLADSPEKRKEYRVNARKLAEASFDRNMLGDQFVDFLEKVGA